MRAFPYHTNEHARVANCRPPKVGEPQEHPSLQTQATILQEQRDIENQELQVELEKNPLLKRALRAEESGSAQPLSTAWTPVLYVSVFFFPPCFFRCLGMRPSALRRLHRHSEVTVRTSWISWGRKVDGIITGRAPLSHRPGHHPHRTVGHGGVL